MKLKSIFAPDSLTTLPHLAMSCRMRSASCSGEPPTATPPCASRRSFTSCVPRMRTTSALSLAMMSRGVPAGIIRPNQLSASNPLSDSLIAGTSGSAGERLLDATPSARMRFTLMCGSEDGMLSKKSCTLPGMRTASPGALPL